MGRKLYKCTGCGKIYGYDEAKEHEFVCSECGTLLVKILPRERAPEVSVERHIEMQSETRIGYGVWTVYRTESGDLVCTCPGFLKYGKCKHVRALQ